MRPLRWCCQAVRGEGALDALRTPCLGHDNRLSCGAAEIGAAAAETVTASRGESRGSGSSSGGSLEEGTSRQGVAENRTSLAGELLPRVPSSPPTTSSAAALAGLQDDCSAASAGGRCFQRGVPLVFSQHFTHVELDALLGPTLSWKDPFEVCMSYVRCDCTNSSSLRGKSPFSCRL